MHPDNLGKVQTIRPGDVNWMVAGSGIVHSERTPPDARASGSISSAYRLGSRFRLGMKRQPPILRTMACLRSPGFAPKASSSL